MKTKNARLLYLIEMSELFLKNGHADLVFAYAAIAKAKGEKQ